MVSRSDAALRSALIFITLITLWRVAMLWVSRADIYVDEAQYWAWGQHLDWGYFSKPPLIGFVIRAFTEIAGSDAPFVLRLPAPLFHAAAAVAVIWAARAYVDLWVAAWAGAIYAAMPLITIGSSLISTDTMMLPFFALALGFYGRLVEAPSVKGALGLGAAVGLGMMGKYAMIYFVICAVLVWVLQPAQRIRLRDAALAGLVAIAIFAPNIWWNIENDGQTVRHVIEENAQLGRLELDWFGALQFVAEQFIALGPILLGALVLSVGAALSGRMRGGELTLMLFSLPIIAMVTVQAVVSGALGNWAATAFIAAPILAASLLQMRPGLLLLSQGVNIVLAVALPLLLAAPGWVTDGSGEPLLKRYIGVDEVSELVADAARAEGLTTLTSPDRGLLADLFYTLDGQGFETRAWADPREAPKSWYHAEFPLARPAPQPVLYLGYEAPDCAGTADIGPIDPGFGVYAGEGLRLWRAPAGC